VPAPHGGKLVNRVVKGERKERLLEEAKEMRKIELSYEEAKDLENIAKGVFSPLEGYLVQEDFLSVLYDMRLSNDVPWTIPIVLDASKEELDGCKPGDDVALVYNGKPIAILHLEDVYTYNKEEYAQCVFKTKDANHPGVARVYGLEEYLLGGKIDLIEFVGSKFPRYALTPLETRVLFKAKGWKTVAGFQTRNVPHLGHEFIQKSALTFVDGVFVNPVIGRKKKGDFRDEVILEAYEVLIKHYYPKDRVALAILETEMRYAGPREAIFHAIVRKNFGCTHFLVGRDHAGVGNYYGPYEAQEIFSEFPDLGITPLFFTTFFYCRKCGGVVNEKICPHGKSDRVYFSGTKIREMISRGERPPPEMMRPEVVEVILKHENPFVE